MAADERREAKAEEWANATIAGTPEALECQSE
jgi:hypothetical protein